MIALDFLESLLHVLPIPGVITDLSGPLIEILVRTTSSSQHWSTSMKSHKVHSPRDRCVDIVQEVGSVHDPTSKIYGSAASEAFPTRIIDFLSLQVRLRFSLVTPVQTCFFES